MRLAARLVSRGLPLAACLALGLGACKEGPANGAAAAKTPATPVSSAAASPAPAAAPAPAAGSAPAGSPPPSTGAVAAGAAAPALPERAIDVTADAKGFTPSRIEAKPREPLVLRFTRTTDDTCADVVVVHGDPVRHVLPLGKTVELRLSAPESGTLGFACGMNMYRGSIVVSG
jgi:Cupredoxin-like domain